MGNDEIWLEAKLKEQIKNYIDIQQQYLCDGVSIDFADYKHRAGKISAAKSCLTMLDDLAKSEDA